MASNTVVINERIKFKIDDSGMEKLILFLDKLGSLILDCNWCGLTILPQVRSHFVHTLEEEFSVKCVGCGKMVKIRMYGRYGFNIDG
jgi:hypothetical protein